MLIGNLQVTSHKADSTMGSGGKGCKENRKSRLCPKRTQSLGHMHEEDSAWITSLETSVDFHWGYDSQSVLDR